MTLRKIDSNIRSIVTAANKVNGLIHETAVMVAEHAQAHGDCTRALALVKAMPASFRRTMLVLWFQTYTPIRIVLTNEKVGMLKEQAKGFTPFDIEAGKETPWYDLAEQNAEKEPLDFDKLVALVAGLAKRIEKKLENGEIVPEDQASAKAIAAKLTGLDLKRVKADNDTEEEAVKKSA